MVSGSMVCAEVAKIDSNFDGNIDRVEHFVEDKTLVMAEFDADKNEEIDQLLLVMNFKVNWSRY